jgi:5-methyltetrahydropteroyltriglutamate--homocysteine methyltransferase
MDFIYQLGGVEKLESDLVVEFKNRSGTVSFTPASMRVDGPVRLEHTIFADDFEFLRDTVGTAVPKLTIPSPSMVHYRGGPAAIDPAVYPDIDEFWDDLSAAYAQEIAEHKRDPYTLVEEIVQGRRY